MSVIAAGTMSTGTGGNELRATATQMETPFEVMRRRESEEKEPDEHFAVLDKANCYAEVPDGSLADVWAVRLERERMLAA